MFCKIVIIFYPAVWSQIGKNQKSVPAASCSTSGNLSADFRQLDHCQALQAALKRGLNEKYDPTAFWRKRLNAKIAYPNR